MKYQRQNKILEIVRTSDVETQDELIEKLRECGYEVTQATVSRDIRELKLAKIAMADNRLKYAAAARDDARTGAKFKNIIVETVMKIDWANNLVVIKTYPGMAQAAAAAIDGMGWNDIVGSIAGDDTVLLIMRSEAKAAEAAGKFVEIIKP